MDISVPRGMQLVIRTTGEFYVEQLIADPDTGEVTRLLIGPSSSTARYLRLGSTDVPREFRVECDRRVEWMIMPNPRVEPGGGDPVEAPLPTAAEESLQESIARAVRAEMYRQREEELGTIEEEDDFEPDDEDQAPFSGHEVIEMPPDLPTPPIPPVDKTAPSAGARQEGLSPNGDNNASSSPPVQQNSTARVPQAPSASSSGPLPVSPGSGS